LVIQDWIDRSPSPREISSRTHKFCTSTSLTVFGQRKPIVVRRTGTDEQGRGVGVVEAGNHTMLAAIQLG
jgi:hypothetical protein